MQKVPHLSEVWSSFTRTSSVGVLAGWHGRCLMDGGGAADFAAVGVGDHMNVGNDRRRRCGREAANGQNKVGS